MYMELAMVLQYGTCEKNKTKTAYALKEAGYRNLVSLVS